MTEGAAEGFPSKFGGIDLGESVKVDGYAGGENYVWRIGVCGRVGKIVGRHLCPWMPQKNPAPRYFNLQVSQVTCIWFGLNIMYENMYINACSGHTKCEKLLHGKVKSW